MPKSDGQKLKIIYIKDYLEKNSHAEKPVRASELIEMLERDHSIRCDRKTIYSDIAALQQYGVDIVSTSGPKGGYYIASRNFELPELKLLIDAVQSSRYLTEKMSKELIGKLCTQCSVHDAKLMQRNVAVSGRVKTMNDSIYNLVDFIQDAIAHNKQITFRYFDWDIHGQRKYRDKSYVASPYGLCQDNSNCYLVAWTERHGITHFRVDRMAGIKSIDKDRIPCPELTGKAFTEYANRTFQMFAGETVNVKLRFHRELVNVVMDRFGQEVMLIPEDGGEYFVFTVPVAVSPMFLSWVIGFGDKAKILWPQSAVDACRDLLQTVMAQY